jgi:hypothetical protein
MTQSKAPALVLTVLVSATALSPLAHKAMAQVGFETPVPSLTTIRLETIRSRDEDLLRDLAQALQTRYPNLLAGTEILFTRVESFGTVFYRMDIQGIEGEEAARDLCRILEMEQCLVARPGASILASPEAFSVAPDGLVDMTADPSTFSPAVSGSVQAEPLPTQGEGWSAIQPVRDTLSQLPLDRPDPESLLSPEPQPWELAIASAEANDNAASADDPSTPVGDDAIASTSPAAPDAPSMMEGVASAIRMPVASSGPSQEAVGSPDDGAALDLDSVLDKARVATTTPPRLNVVENLEATARATNVAQAPVVSVSVEGVDGAPVPLSVGESDGAAIAALTEKVGRIPPTPTLRPQGDVALASVEPSVAAAVDEPAAQPADVQVATADTIRPRPRPTTGVFAQVAANDAPADAPAGTPVEQQTAIQVATAETIRPRPRPTTGVFARNQDAAPAPSVDNASTDHASTEEAPTDGLPAADTDVAALPKPVWEAGPRPTRPAQSAATATRKEPTTVAPTRAAAEAVLASAPLRSIPTVRPDVTAAQAQAGTRAQALALAVEEAREARVAERLAQAVDDVPTAPSSATSPVIRVDAPAMEPSSVAGVRVEEDSVVDVRVADANTIRPRPRPTTGVFAEMAAAAAARVEQDTVVADAAPVAGDVGRFERSGAGAVVVPGLRPAATAEAASVGQSGTAPTARADVVGKPLPDAAVGALVETAQAAVPEPARPAPSQTPKTADLPFALPATGTRLSWTAPDHGAWSQPNTGDVATTAAADAARLAIADAAPKVPATTTTYRFHADVALADSGEALLAFRAPRSNAFARWALGTVAFPTDSDFASAGPLPAPVRVVPVAWNQGLAPVAVGAVPMEGTTFGVAALSSAPARAAPNTILQASQWVAASLEADVAQISGPALPALRPQDLEAVGTFASLAAAGMAAEAARTPPQAAGRPLAAPVLSAVEPGVVPPTSDGVAALPPVQDALSVLASHDTVAVTPARPIDAVAPVESESVLLSRITALVLVGTSPSASPTLAQESNRVAGVEVASLRLAGVDAAPTRVAGTPVTEAEPETAVLSADAVVAVLASADTPRPRMRPTTGAFAQAAEAALVQDPIKVAVLFPTLRPDAAVGAESAVAETQVERPDVLADAGVVARVRADAVPLASDDRPIHDYLEVWNVSMPLTRVDIEASRPKSWGEVEAPAAVVEAVFAPTVRLIAGADEAPVFQVIGASSADPQTLDDFLGVLTSPDVVFDVPTSVDFDALAKERAANEAERALLSSVETGPAPTSAALPGLRPTADSIAAAAATDGGAAAASEEGLPATIRATVGSDSIEMSTDTRRVVVPRKAAPVSRFAVSMTDTYAMPFDLTGTGIPALQRMPTLRPAIVDAAAPVEAVLVAAPDAADAVPSDPADMARFFPAAGSIEATPVVPDVFEGEQPTAALDAPLDPADPALAMMDRLRGGLDETLSTLEIPVEAPPEEVVAAAVAAQETALPEDTALPQNATGAAPGPSRPMLELPPLEVEGRPTAEAPLAETAALEDVPSVPVTQAPVEGGAVEPRVTTFDAPNPVPFAQDPMAVAPVADAMASLGAPGSTGAASPGAVSQSPNEALMVRLSYADSPEAVQVMVRSLQRSFPPALLERGRFFGKSAPASPGLYIVGIEANTQADLEGLIAYMQANGIPYVLAGQSAAPLLAQQP